MSDQITLGAVGEAIAAGLLSSSSLTAALERADQLARAADIARRVADASTAASAEAHEAGVAALLTGQAAPTPITVREARWLAEDASEAASQAGEAAKRAASSVSPVFVDQAADLAHQLEAALADLLERARPDAQVLSDAGPIRWDDVAGIHELPKPAQASFHRLAALAEPRHDLTRRAALSLQTELSITKRVDGQRRRAILTALDDAAYHGPERQRHPLGDGAWMGLFIGYGIVGPLPRLYGTGSPLLSRRWLWQPHGHAVERLVNACLAVPEPEPDPIEENEPPAKAGQRVPIRPVAAILRR